MPVKWENVQSDIKIIKKDSDSKSEKEKKFWTDQKT